jgi:hypothetical protein
MTEHRTAHDSELSTDQIATEGEASAQLLEGEELQGVVLRWREIQAQFVTNPDRPCRTPMPWLPT